jgi:hypothetical protein
MVFNHLFTILFCSLAVIDSLLLPMANIDTPKKREIIPFSGCHSLVPQKISSDEET